ncbi:MULTISPECIES: threonine/serine dehydratase [unclassified Wenzhouxiangella]|uniref:threonine ammonia-lyase n=1 Tax=unclassified Wenzhouxiangella TaxID=2613841 RepID=UPI000E32CAE7|nr:MULTISPECIES: threonine/serine dehydratase [unclassified Wenzhouxiangella]RFF28535.1 threonine/serine dehydratase [Wenzhouxiangella sp. 15181]RFP70053.1 threonine/serine dehydratase [Wenzhouxiangella sp. 15190]
MSVKSLPNPEDVVRARERIRSMIRETPVMTSDMLDELTGATLFFKCEHLQTTGSFKLRGASHAVSLLSDDCPGVATHSSGNHGAALARAASLRGFRAEIVVPEGAVADKVENIRRHGGNIHFCEPTQAGREAALARLVDQGFEPVPPYDDDRIITGQGSAALELMEQVENLDMIVTPVGGGGLVSGTALAAQTAARPPRVVGIEPSGADDTARSLAMGRRVDDHRPETIADGLRALVGERNLALIRCHVDAVLTVSEDQIISAMERVWAELKQTAEPSGAVALAGIMADPDRFSGQRVGVMISGGNLAVSVLLGALR